MEISLKTNEIQARLEGIQKSPNYTTSTFMSNLENELLEELQKVLKLEEEFWKLKSRIQWIQDGDANTKIFHLTTLQRRRKNRIFSIRDEAGN